MKSDIDIARAATTASIVSVAEKIGIPADAVLNYGPTKAKINMEFISSLKNRPSGKLVLVTAMTPTPAGEGKTTTTVGLGLFTRAITWTLLWHEGWRGRWRFRPGSANGRHQLALHG
jgi:formyltetrahydrofolate synthetase